MTPTRTLVTSALLAAMLAVSALITVPVGAVPITLQTFVVAIVILVCTPSQAALAVGIYLLLGAVGAPVFSGMQGGLAALIGPTGGYLVGFWLAAVGGATVRVRLRTSRPLADMLALVLALAVIYVPGTLWLAASTGRTLPEAVAVGVAPFIVFDVAKGVAAVSVAAALRRAGLVTPGRELPGRPSGVC
jgi:biotin transport system substrate-specific component